MSSYRVLLALCLFIGIVSSTVNENAAGPSLVINLFRHGARGPRNSDFDKSWDPKYLGQLTPAGERQQYLMGAGLARKYPHIFGKPFDRKKVHVRTSESTRCEESAILQIYGAYEGTGPALDPKYPAEKAVPPFDTAIINDLVKKMKNDEAVKGGFVPIVLHSVPMKQDILLETPATCPASYLDAKKTVINSTFMNFWFDTFEPTKKALKEKGYKVTNPFDLQGLVDTLYANELQNMPPPGGIDYDSQLFHNVTTAGTWFFVQGFYSSPFQKAMLPVPIFEEVFRHMDAKAAKNTSVEFVFLSTHDSTLMTVLAALDIVNEECLRENFFGKAGEPFPHPTCIFPPFAANILFEFYDNNGKPYVVLRYNDIAVPLCNGKPECSYQDFKALVKKATNNYTVKDYDKKCMNGMVEDIKYIIEELKKIFKFFLK